MAAAIITQARLKELLSLIDGRFVRSQRTAPQHSVGEEPGWLNAAGYRSMMLDGRTYAAHRLVWLYVHGAFPEKAIDHINGIRTDNRIENLRDADRTTQAHNRHGASTGNESGELGVTRNRGRGKPWRASIQVNGKLVYLGSFDSIPEAKAVYLTAKHRLHPAFVP